VSRVDIYNINVLETMLRLVEKYQLKPCQICLEITESAYSEDSKQLITAVTELRAHGFVIEMDDFGKGYSSLSILSELPIDIIKLDMNFIKNVLETNGKKDIVMFIMQLSKWLHLQVIAEGVETREQVEELLRKECYYAQGYYFAKPMPSQQFAEYLKAAEIGKVAVSGEETASDE
jgi:EAL domain-containing protein (putative c-di-GMP-specific phosphodiesterase class I)